MKRIFALVLLFGLLLSGCAAAGVTEEGVPELPGLTFVEETPLQYAVCFRLYRYEGGYTAITVTDGEKYLVVPQGADVPRLDKGWTVLQQPIENIYLVATAAMSLLDALDAVPAVRLSGARQESWYIPHAAEAMAAGELLYAGKYSEPDYELLLRERCGLAIESTMIYHSPEVQEKIEELGIPVFVECSGRENHPLGRTEWIKVYGALLGREEQAEEIFSAQSALLDTLSDFKNTEKTVAFFYVANNGTVSVRKSSDYLATMIELAGGRYIFPELGDSESSTSGVTMTMEEFYAGARDADYIIYNATIDEPMNSVSELLAKSELFADFKAVKSGNVWCTGKYLYQATDSLAGMILDIHTILTDSGADGQLTFIHRLSDGEREAAE